MRDENPYSSFDEKPPARERKPITGEDVLQTLADIVTWIAFIVMLAFLASLAAIVFFRSLRF